MTEEIAVASLSTVPIGVVLAMVPFRDLRKPTRTQGISTWWWVGSLGAFVGAVGPSIPLVLMAVFLGLLLLEGRTTQNSDRLRLDPISGVAHDLRTPLTGIRLHTQSLRETPRMGSKRRAWHLEVIEGEVDRMTRLISGLLHPASVERGTRTYHRIPSEMGELVERSLRTMKATSRKGGPRLERVFCGESLPFLGDPDAVVMAVAEVVRNAVKYSDGKPVRVETLWKPGFVGVRVIDRGLGIAKQEQERVFEPFFRSSRPEIQAVDGTGFGLSLVEQTVNSHGGHLEVESDSFQGTRLTLWFPGKVQG